MTASTPDELIAGFPHSSLPKVTGEPIFEDLKVIRRLLNTNAMIVVKLLPLPQPPLRARTDARTNPSAQRATQLRSVPSRVYAVARQNQITTTVT
jgi:hypothetical protein